MRLLSAACLAILLSSSILGIVLLAPPAPAEAADCRFVLGFKALHDLIPEIVGDCRGGERHNPANGDGLQETAAWHGKGGLLVWRKADNWTAFTDGTNTWINGPHGLQKRRNDERFPWERAAGPAGACDVGESDIRYVESELLPDGSTGAYWTIRNSCDRPVDLTLDGQILAARDGPPIADAPTAHVIGLAPGASKRVELRFPTASDGWYAWRVATADSERLCGGPSGPWRSCVEIDPWLIGPLDDLMSTPDGEWLVKVSAENGVRVRRGELPAGALGMYDHVARVVTIDQRLDAYSSWLRAVVLTHELQHAADGAAGNLPTSSEGCYLAEGAAFARQAALWRHLWSDRLPNDYTALHAEFNAITRTIVNDPAGFSRVLMERYAADCGGE